MSATATQELVWPTGKEYRTTVDAVNSAFQEVDAIRWTLEQMIDVDVSPSLKTAALEGLGVSRGGAPPATFERLGLLAHFEEWLRLEIGLLEDALKEIEGMRRAVSLTDAPEIGGA